MEKTNYSTHDSERLLSMSEAAQRLGISLPKFKIMAARGEITSVRVGRRRLIADSTLRSFIQSLLAMHRDNAPKD